MPTSTTPPNTISTHFPPNPTTTYEPPISSTFRTSESPAHKMPSTKGGKDAPQKNISNYCQTCKSMVCSQLCLRKQSIGSNAGKPTPPRKDGKKDKGYGGKSR